MMRTSRARILLRCAGVAAAVALFYSWSWDGPVRVFTALIACGLGALGDRPVIVGQGGLLEVVVGAQVFAVDRECTYGDLVLLALPLSWSARWGAGVNGARWLALALLILGANALRVIGGMHAMAHGATWLWAHDVPDFLLYYPALGLAVVRSLREDLGCDRTERGFEQSLMAGRAAA